MFLMFLRSLMFLTFLKLLGLISTEVPGVTPFKLSPVWMQAVIGRLCCSCSGD